LFALGFLSQFLIAGITGVMQASIPLDIHFHGTYWLVGHFHYALFGAAVFAAISGVYYWFPKMTGRMYNEKLGGLHFILAFLGFNGTYLPMFWLGLNGMPRRVATYIPEFTGVNRFVSICGFILGFSFVVFWINMIYSWLSGPKAPQNPWKALTLEWTVPSPPPPGENFEHEPPQVPDDPYGFGTGLQYPGWPPPQKPDVTPEPTA
jgi:cytochrome c oxidase subunit 1